MKAARLTGPNTIEYMDVDDPTPAPDEVLVRVHRSAVCGTDAEMFRGTMPYFKMGWTRYPITLGHEWAGEVVDRGNEVTEFSIGDRVTGDVTIGCARCDNCKRGLYSLCVQKAEVGLCRGKDGAYAQYLTMPARHTYALPKGSSFEEGAFTEPAATVVRAIRKAQFEPGAICVVQGDGPIGLLGLQAVNACGAGLSILSGTIDEKLALGKKLGADVIVNVCKEDLAEVVRQHTDDAGADFVMEASGSVEAVQQAVDVVRMGGTISVVGIHEVPVPNLDMGNIVVRDIDLVTSVASPNAFKQTLRLMEKRTIDVRPLISHEFPLSAAAEAIDVQQNRAAERMKIHLLPQA